MGTFSGISTIYILISVGLAVDYSAHIAHMFVESTGTGPQRAIAALERIGPSVFNAVLSTMVAVVIWLFRKLRVSGLFQSIVSDRAVGRGARVVVFAHDAGLLWGGQTPNPAFTTASEKQRRQRRGSGR